MICFDKKICTKCSLEKSYFEFSRRIKLTGQVHEKCRNCQRLHTQCWYKKNIQRAKDKNKSEKVQQYFKDYRARPEVKKKGAGNTANYRSKKMQRTPIWADLEAIAEFYKNCPKGMHVDHIISLQGKIVSGFHVMENLQYLTAFENLSKRNNF